MRLNGNMATEVAKEAFLPALKYGASSPTRCEGFLLVLLRCNLSGEGLETAAIGCCFYLLGMAAQCWGARQMLGTLC